MQPGNSFMCSSFLFVFFFFPSSSFAFLIENCFPLDFLAIYFAPHPSVTTIAASGSRSTVLIKACEQKENKRKYKHENQPKWMRNGEQERSQHRCSIFWTATRIDCIYRWWTDLTRRRCGTKTLLFCFLNAFPIQLRNQSPFVGFRREMDLWPHFPSSISYYLVLFPLSVFLNSFCCSNFFFFVWHNSNSGSFPSFNYAPNIEAISYGERKKKKRFPPSGID